jgi:extradiol dioxygenase family protein
MPHFGLTQLPAWQTVGKRLKSAGMALGRPPQGCFEGQRGMQWTLCFRDPFGHPMEIKGFASTEAIFAP